MLYVVRREREEMEWNVVVHGDVHLVLVVADDAGDVHLEVVAPPSVQEIKEAMALPGDHDGYPLFPVGEEKPVGHSQAPTDLAELIIQILPRDLEAVHVPANPHEKHALHGIGVLVEVDDIPAVIEDPVGNCGDDPLCIITLDQRGYYGGLVTHAKLSPLLFGRVVKSPLMAFYSTESEKCHFPFPHKSSICAPLSGRIDDFLRSHHLW